MDGRKSCECVRGTTSGHDGFSLVFASFPVMAALVAAIHVMPLLERVTRVAISCSILLMQLHQRFFDVGSNLNRTTVGLARP